MNTLKVTPKADVKKYTQEEVYFIANEAYEAANNSAKEVYNLMKGDRGCCGFAWVVIKDLRSNTKVAKWLSDYGFGKEYTGGISVWNPSKMSVQSLDIKEAGAYAYAEVLRKYNFNAVERSRMD